MRHIPISCEQRDAMLRAVGAASSDELFEDVPVSARLGRPLAIPGGCTEMELVQHLESLARANAHAGELVSFMGAGCYDHYVPSIVDHVLCKPEFFTAYTPYQPEVSQGTLQAIFEFQTMICELTGMDVANASMYDGATAMVEAAYLAVHHTGRKKVAVAASVHPEWRETLRTYAAAGLLDVVEVPLVDGGCDVNAVASVVEDAAALLVADPNFYGCIEDLEALGAAAHAAGALFVVATNPILSCVMQPPSVFGADVVVGEAQVLGSAMSFGGPGLGYFACRSSFLRRMPGRIVGETVDADGKRAYVLTMQTREQHIRREKATSNICSNHALNALAACVYLGAVGVRGLEGVGTVCIQRAHYMHDSLVATGAFESAFARPYAHEFALRYHGDVAHMQSAMLERGFLAGVDLGRFGSEMSGVVLLAVTERRSRAEIDAFVEEVTSL